MANMENDQKEDRGISVLDRPDLTLKHPSMYVVLVHNDPVTQREFVVEVLTTVFHKSVDQAIRVMTTAHTKGAGTAGIYTKEIAETKTAAATSYSRSRGQILQFSFEEQS